jgi:hypothetical protein
MHIKLIISIVKIVQLYYLYLFESSKQPSLWLRMHLLRLFVFVLYFFVAHYICICSVAFHCLMYKCLFFVLDFVNIVICLDLHCQLQLNLLILSFPTISYDLFLCGRVTPQFDCFVCDIITSIDLKTNVQYIVQYSFILVLNPQNNIIL